MLKISLMQPSNSRTLKSLKPVLQNPDSTGPDPVYKVFTDSTEKEWVNKTVIQPGRLGEEYTKTFGHYHTHPASELYRVASGEGVLILQKGKPDMVEEVLLVRAKAGDEILIAPEYGHSWSNTGTENLVLLDNWKGGHMLQDYQFVEDHQGMAYYLIDKGDKMEAVKNPTCKNLPDCKWINAKNLQEGIGRLA